MLGRFLELGIVTPHPDAAWSELQQLGFAGATSGEIWPYAYGAVACEALAIGLHATGEEPLSLYFVQPDVAGLRRELLNRFIDFETERLGSDVFNEIGLREPGGMLLRVIGARTFSPPPEIPGRTMLGKFLRISLPCQDLAEALGFWERLDLTVTQLDDPWESLAVDDLPIGCHGIGDFREPLLLFDGVGTVNAEALRASGLAAGRPLPSLNHRAHQLLRGPGGVAMLVLT